MTVMSPWFVLQIAVEAVFFVVILVLLWRLKNRIERYRPLADGTVVEDLKRVVSDSQASADAFLAMLEENKKTLGRLAHQLDDRERRLAALIAEAETAIRKLEAGSEKEGTASSVKSYDDAIGMVQRGASREELTQKSGLTEDEINLLMAFARARRDPGD